jgi:hypothetical protein
MTIAITVRVPEGIALAADTATSVGVKGVAEGIGQIYHGTRKLIRLHADLPLAMITFGQGTLPTKSVAQLAVGLRERLLPGAQWEVKPDAYGMDEIATRVADYYREVVQAAVDSGQPPHTPVGFLVAGLPAGSDEGEVWEVEIAPDATTKGPAILEAGQKASVQYRGFTDVLDRLIIGADRNVYELLASKGVSPHKLEIVRPETPLVDAVEVADWLAQVAHGGVRFSQIAPMVGGAIDLAHISREKGFVWARQQKLPVDEKATDELK